MISKISYIMVSLMRHSTEFFNELLHDEIVEVLQIQGTTDMSVSFLHFKNLSVDIKHDASQNKEKHPDRFFFITMSLI